MLFESSPCLLRSKIVPVELGFMATLGYLTLLENLPSMRNRKRVCFLTPEFLSLRSAKPPHTPTRVQQPYAFCNIQQASPYAYPDQRSRSLPHGENSNPNPYGCPTQEFLAIRWQRYPLSHAEIQLNDKPLYGTVCIIPSFSYNIPFGGGWNESSFRLLSVYKLKILTMRTEPVRKVCTGVNLSVKPGFKPSYYVRQMWPRCSPSENREYVHYLKSPRRLRSLIDMYDMRMLKLLNLIKLKLNYLVQ